MQEDNLSVIIIKLLLSLLYFFMVLYSSFHSVLSHHINVVRYFRDEIKMDLDGKREKHSTKHSNELILASSMRRENQRD